MNIEVDVCPFEFWELLEDNIKKELSLDYLVDHLWDKPFDYIIKEFRIGKDEINSFTRKSHPTCETCINFDQEESECVKYESIKFEVKSTFYCKEWE